MQKNKVLILGADGFIGSNLVKAFVKENKCSVRAFDLFKDGKSKNLDDVSDAIEIFSGNFLNRDDIARALDGIEYVFHFISLTTPGSSMNDPLIDVETNIKGTIVLLDECVKEKVKRVIFASSGGAIYGDQNRDKYSENDPTDPISPYAISKLAIEKYLKFYKKHHNLDYLILRYSNPYGPGQNVTGSQGIIPIFLNLIKEDREISIFGDGSNIRDYIFIDDLINITLQLYAKSTKYSVYNVGSGISASINTVVNILKEVSKKNINVKYLPERDVDVRNISMDISRISNELGLKDITELRNGIQKTWNWINKK